MKSEINRWKCILGWYKKAKSGPGREKRTANLPVLSLHAAPSINEHMTTTHKSRQLFGYVCKRVKQNIEHLDVQIPLEQLAGKQDVEELEELGPFTWLKGNCSIINT